MFVLAAAVAAVPQEVVLGSTQVDPTRRQTWQSLLSFS